MEVIVKPTVACNGTCVYCAADDGQKKERRMGRERLGEFFLAFRDWLRQDPRHVLRFTWHGGEPLLCGPEFYHAVAEEQHRVFHGELARVKNQLQSNLSLISEEWISCLRDFMGCEVIGTSFDIVPGIRGLADQRDLSAVWIRAVRLLRSHGFRIGVVYVVHRHSLARVGDIYYYFRNLDSSLSLRFNPLYQEGRADRNDNQSLWITPTEYGEFLIELWRVWTADRQRVPVMPLREWQRAWNGQAGLCCDSSGRCQETYLGVNPDGTVYGCGRFSDDGSHPLGNIFSDSLSAILNHPLRRELAHRTARLREGPCRECRFWSLCHGGCPSDAWIYYRDLFQPTHFCPARICVFEHFEKLFGPPRSSAAMREVAANA